MKPWTCSCGLRHHPHDGACLVCGESRLALFIYDRTIPDWSDIPHSDEIIEIIYAGDTK